MVDGLDYLLTKLQAGMDSQVLSRKLPLIGTNLKDAVRFIDDIRTGGIDASTAAPWLTIVGVVANIKQDALDTDSRMALYMAQTQTTPAAMSWRSATRLVAR